MTFFVLAGYVVFESVRDLVARAEADTFLCAWLSVILLARLVLNATLGWRWADPLAVLAIACLAVRDGREAWFGEGEASHPS